VEVIVAVVAVEVEAALVAALNLVDVLAIAAEDKEGFLIFFSI
jgi:hypothetical protein